MTENAKPHLSINLDKDGNVISVVGADGTVRTSPDGNLRETPLTNVNLHGTKLFELINVENRETDTTTCIWHDSLCYYWIC